MEKENQSENEKLNNRQFLDRLSTGQWLKGLAVGSLLLLLIAITGIVAFFLYRPRSTALPIPKSLDQLATQFPELGNLLKDEKLNSVYKQFLVTYQEGGVDAAYELARKRGMLSAKDEVLMTLELDTDQTADLQESLKAHGIIVTAASGNLVDIAIPVEVLQASLESGDPGLVFMDISSLDHIVRIRLPIKSIEDFGSVETEGVEVIGADTWQTAGITGKGIKIGVLDMGFDGYKNLLGSDLPSSVLAQSFRHGVEVDNVGTVHGTAVAEIIHDIAPDAELVFAAYQTTTEMKAAVEWLMAQNVDIISNSTGTIFGRRDGKSPEAMVADQAFQKGILWVNSSGNTGYSHYRAKFTDIDGDGYHEFDKGDELMGFSPVGAASLALNWDDWDNGTQDFDLFIYNHDGDVIASSEDTQSGPGSYAGEFIYYEFPDEGPYYAAIYAVNYDREVTFDFFLRDGVIEYYNPEYSVTTPGDAKGALTVGAIDWESGELEDYSSRGPTTDGRIKPEIVAPSGVSSAAYGETWIGTSASCPHVSGAAALVMQAFPEYSASQVRDFLFSRAIDMSTSGMDSDTGYGELWLGDPPEISGLPPTPPTETAPLPNPTEEPVLEATEVKNPTSTPVLKSKPKSTNNGESDGIFRFLLFGCVLLPGALGLGGIGLLGVVFYRRRNQAKSNEDDHRYWGLPDEFPVRPAQPITPPPIIPGPPPLPASPMSEMQVGSVVCWNCGKVNPPKTRFCTACGTNIKPIKSVRLRKANFCANCGNPLRPNAKFCSKCGHPINQG